MKKSLYLFGAILITSSVLMLSCSKPEEPKQNFYGVTPENHGTPKAAYYTFAGLIILLAIGLALLIKKIKGK